MKLTLGEKLFVGLPACIVLLIVVDATYWWPTEKWLRLSFELVNGYLMWVIWENRHGLRRRRHD